MDNRETLLRARRSLFVNFATDEIRPHHLSFKKMVKAGIISAITLNLLFFSDVATSAEGMWPVDSLPIEQMEKRYAFRPTPGWADKVMRSSIHLSGGCSGFFVSRSGLAVTNQHCAAKCLAESLVEGETFDDKWFIAKAMADEIPCREISVKSLEEIQDVTEEVEKVLIGVQGDEMESRVGAIKNKIKSECVRDNLSRYCDIVESYNGRRFHLYKYKQFTDVRLVWIPEERIAFFGGNFDNFDYPRFNLDVAILRVYDNNKPAEIAHYFSFRGTKADQGEILFIAGHPTSTKRHWTVSQLSTFRDFSLINRLLELSELRGVLRQYSKGSPKNYSSARDLLSNVENAHKALSGQLAVLLSTEFFTTKHREEIELRRFVDANSALESVKGAWTEIEIAQRKFRMIEKMHFMFERGGGFFSNYFNYARTLVRAAEERSKPQEERMPEFFDSELISLKKSLSFSALMDNELEKLKLAFSLSQLRERIGADHHLIKDIFGNRSADELSLFLIDNTKLGDKNYRLSLWDGGNEAIAKSNDPFIKLVKTIEEVSRSARLTFINEVNAVEKKNLDLIGRARWAQSGDSVYPDANATLRISYGELKGWDEAGESIKPVTTIDEFSKKIGGMDPFLVPPTWLNFIHNLNPGNIFNFVTTHDTVVGNSGSPVFNRNHDVVGIIFDGNAYSLGGAFWYDENRNRAIAVGSNTVIQALKNIYAADELVSELTR